MLLRDAVFGVVFKPQGKPLWIEGCSIWGRLLRLNVSFEGQPECNQTPDCIATTQSAGGSTHGAQPAVWRPLPPRHTHPALKPRPPRRAATPRRARTLRSVRSFSSPLMLPLASLIVLFSSSFSRRSTSTGDTPASLLLLLLLAALTDTGARRAALRTGRPGGGWMGFEGVVSGVRMERGSRNALRCGDR